MNNLKTAYVSFFSGIGGWDLGAYWAGARFDEHYYSEIDPFASKVFQRRFPEAIALGDITKLNESHFSKDMRYVFTGSFPCQNLSVSGKRDGIEGKKSRLWFEFLRLIGVCKPAVVLVENVAALSIRGLDVVIAGLAQEGYSAYWRVISAADVGAPHLRKRMWIVAFPSYGHFIEGVNPMAFKINRRICGTTGNSSMSLESVNYLDFFHVGVCKYGGVYSWEQSVADKMPLGGFLVGQDVLAVPAWEGGLEVNEILENSNDYNGGCNFSEGSRPHYRGVESSVGGATSDFFTGAGSEHEAMADSDCSRWQRQSLFEEELPLRREFIFGDSRYSKLEGAWDIKPGVQRMVDGVPWYVGSRQEVPFPVITEKNKDLNKMLTCYGNALLPQIAWIIWRRVKSLIPDCFID